MDESEFKLISLEVSVAITVSYELGNADVIDHNRIQSFFERFHWESTGRRSYRYPGSTAAVSAASSEDWLNHIVPALMLFRAYTLKRELSLKRWYIDAHSVSAPSSDGAIPAPIHGSELPLRKTDQGAFGERNLRKWLDEVMFGVPYE